MGQASIEVVETKLFPGAVADELVAAVQDAIEERGECSLVLSGGGTPGSMYRQLSRPPRVTDVDWAKVSIFWGDERFVPEDNIHSNYKMADETLLHNIPEPGPSIYKVNTSLPSAEDAAKDYESSVREALGLSEGQIPEFDIVLLGVGEHGGVASVFPNSDAVNTNGSLCKAVDDPSGEYKCITFGANVLFAAKRIYFLVRGEEKAEVARLVIESTSSNTNMPATFYKDSSGKVTWFLDSKAAESLSLD